MGKTTIEWTDRTWNPVRGCSRVSEGCRNCYAERMAARFSRSDMGPAEWTARDEGGDLPPFFGFAEMTKSGPRWTGRVELVESKLQEPVSWRKPSRVFVNSMSDLFHENLPDEDIMRVVRVMQSAYWHTYQILTKRSRRLLDFTRWMAGADDISAAEWPRQCWLGVSVESQAMKNRIDELRATPAAVRFLSLEPLLEDLGKLDLTGIDWVIVGGESGPGSRPMHPDWARSIRDQCQASGVAFFFKQWGEWRPAELGCSCPEHMFDGQWTTYHWWPGGPVATSGEAVEHREMDRKTRAVRVGKKAADRLLDGRTWDEFPGAARA